MNELINIEYNVISEEQEPTVNARGIYEFLKVESPFHKWISRRLSDSQLLVGQDYVIRTIVSEKKGPDPKEYILTLDSAKHISMLERNDKGRQIRQYFIEFEKKAKAIFSRAANASSLSTQEDNATNIVRNYLQVANLLQCPTHIAQLEAVKSARIKTGVDYSPLLLKAPAQDDIQEQDEMLEPSGLGYLFGLTGSVQVVGKRINSFLFEQGLQVKEGNQWAPTEAGISYSFKHSWESGRKTGYNLKWNVAAIKSLWEEEQGKW